MKGVPVIAIFDIGKTNKKIFLFDEQYRIVHEVSKQFDEIADEDGFACEDVEALSRWVKDSFDKLLANPGFIIQAVNFSAYGASFVYLDKNGRVITPLYNYLKPFPEELHDKFYAAYGGEEEFAHRTASPVLGNLNSGLQIYRLKYQKPELFREIDTALHLPQYISFLISGKKTSDITSIGSHTGLWDFRRNNYHDWVHKEGIDRILAPVISSSSAIKTNIRDHKFLCGVGLHDSSAALIPYLAVFKDPFVLLSTGTWNITLNPFNQEPLTTEELKHDCLCYMSYQGRPVKASRLFAGHEHEEQTKLLATHFQKPQGYYNQVSYKQPVHKNTGAGQNEDGNHYLAESYEQSYHRFMQHLLKKQQASTDYVMTGNVKKIFVDGGFSKNQLFMNILSDSYPHYELYAATVAQASALGAAMSVHHAWNQHQIPSDVISLESY